MRQASITEFTDETTIEVDDAEAGTTIGYNFDNWDEAVEAFIDIIKDKQHD